MLKIILAFAKFQYPREPSGSQIEASSTIRLSIAPQFASKLARPLTMCLSITSQFPSKLAGPPTPRYLHKRWGKSIQARGVLQSSSSTCGDSSSNIADV